MSQGPWFKEWFDTEYYHLLYNKRNDDEAHAFIFGLTNKLNIPAGAKVADIACGKGRHSRVLAELGFSVYGYDLSENSIAFAKSQSTPHAQFFAQDIRDPYPHQNFNVAFNLFTSFGYFDDPLDDNKCLMNIYEMLKPGGFFIQDYLNGQALIDGMPMEGVELRGDIRFSYKKTWESPFIVKRITVEDNLNQHFYMEKVKVYSQSSLLDLHIQAGFENVGIYGDYLLNPFNAQISPRIILICQKPHA